MRKPCCDMQDTNKGAWSKQEDLKLIDYIRKHGEGCWRTLPQAAGLLRCGKSCRLRWINYLRPDLKRGNFAEDEEDLIVKLHALLGNRWSLIAGRLPGRTDNEVKNYWNSHLRKKLMSMGIDPNNHRPNNVNLSRLHHQNSKTASSTATLSAALKNPSNYQQQARSGGNNSCDQKSDGTSCLEDDSCGRLPDLNLNLTITAPLWNPVPDNLKEEQNFESKMSKKSSEFASSTRTPLFR